MVEESPSFIGPWLFEGMLLQDKTPKQATQIKQYLLRKFMQPDFAHESKRYK
jgi:hypothetical protein